MMRGPVMVIVLLSVCARGQWVESAWERDNAYRGTQTFWSTAHSIIYTQRVSATNSLVRTNQFLFNISPTNYTPDPITNDFTFNIVEVTTNGAVTNRTYAVTDVKSLQQTNLFLGWRAQIKWDCAMATHERVAGLGIESNTAAGVRFYHEDVEQLVYLKDRLDAIMTAGRYFSSAAYSNLIANTNLTSANDVTWQFMASTSTVDLKLYANIGTNFISYTPYIDLFFTNSYHKRTMTCEYVIATSSTNVITQTVVRCDSGYIGQFPYELDISGTNGQKIQRVFTNGLIDPDLNASHFGYYAFRRVITNLAQTIDFDAVANFNRRAFYTSNSPVVTVSEVQGVAFTNWLNAAPDTWYGAYAVTFMQEPSSREISADIGGGGTSVFAFAAAPAVAAHVQVFAGASLYHPPSISGDAATNALFNSFGTGLQRITSNGVPLYLSFDGLGWDGTIRITNTVTLADFPPLIVWNVGGGETNSAGSQGFNIEDAYALAWFYGVSVTSPAAFRYR